MFLFKSETPSVKRIVMRKSFALVAVLYALSLRAETYTASDVSGEIDWSSISFSSDWESGESSEAEIALAGNATITLPSGFSAKSITFTGDYAVTLKEATDATTLSSITTLTGGDHPRHSDGLHRGDHRPGGAHLSSVE